MGYVIYWGCNPFTNLLLSSWHIQVQAAPPLLSSPPLLLSFQNEFALNFCKLAQIKKTNKVWNLSAWFRLVSYNDPCYLSCKCIGNEVLPEPELWWSWVFFLFFSKFYLEPTPKHLLQNGWLSIWWFQIFTWQNGEEKSFFWNIREINTTLRNEKTRVIQGQGI